MTQGYILSTFDDDDPWLMVSYDQVEYLYSKKDDVFRANVPMRPIVENEALITELRKKLKELSGKK